MRLLAALLAGLVLGGCSLTRVAYDNADLLLRWRATGFLDVHGELSEQLDSSIGAFLAWHRASALPQYAQVADEAAARLARGLQRADLVWGYDAFVVQARESLRAAATEIAPLLDRLGPEQIEHLRQRLEEDNRRFAAENLRATRGERQAKRMQRNVDRLEEWFGPLTAAQAERVRAYAERAPVDDELRDADRRRLQKELLGVVQARRAQQELPGLAARWDRGRDPAYSAALRAAREEFYAMMVDIDRSLSAAQRARAVERLQGLARDFSLLAARAP